MPERVARFGYGKVEFETANFNSFHLRSLYEAGHDFPAANPERIIAISRNRAEWAPASIEQDGPRHADTGQSLEIEV